jgi:hypothetical protein
MPVTLDNMGATNQTSTATLALTLTLGSNAVLVAGYMIYDLAVSVSAVAYGGVALTRMGRANISAGGGCGIEIWALTAPASGSNVLSANLVGGVVEIWQVGAISFLNAKAAAPFGTVVLGSLSALNAVSWSLSSSTTDIAVTFWAALNNVRPTVGTSISGVESGAYFGTAARYHTGATVLSVSATISAAAPNHCFMGLNIIFSSVAAGSPRYPMLTLTGVGR